MPENSTPESSSERPSEQGPEQAYERLKRLEVSDPLGSIFPRTKKNRMAALVLLTLSLVFFGGLALWINWPKDRPESEPLPPQVRAKIARLPQGVNVLIYFGLKDVRATGFWNSFIPDSVKNSPVFADTTALGKFSKATNFNFTKDTDTVIYAAISHAMPNDRFISIVDGRFNRDSVLAYLNANSDNQRQSGNTLIFRTDPRLWVSVISPNEIVMASNADMIESYLAPEKDFFKADTVLTKLLDRTQYKSHFWMALGEPGWAAGAMQGITSSNQGLHTMGNLRRVRELVLSVKLTDGLKGQTEWIYESKSAAFFASGLLWITLRVSGSSGTRLADTQKELLNQIAIQQNLESIILHTDLSKEFIERFRQTE